MEREKKKEEERIFNRVVMRRKKKRWCSLCSVLYFLSTNTKQIQLDRSMTIITTFINRTTFGRYSYTSYVVSIEQYRQWCNMNEIEAQEEKKNNERQLHSYLTVDIYLE
jgi:hypothetical protein